MNRIDQFTETVKAFLDVWEARVCTARECPIVGLHNTDECANLILSTEEQ